MTQHEDGGGSEVGDMSIHPSSMDARPRLERVRRGIATAWTRVVASPALLAVALFVILLLRRGQQLFQPQVWNEEGTQLLPGFVADGAWFLLEPGRKYFLLAPKLISWLALSTSFSMVPLVGTLLAWAFTLAVLVLIARHPSLLRGGALLAFAALMIPTDAEAFGVPLYTLWWAPLLLAIPLFWNGRADVLVPRAACIALGGLSSPLIGATWPAFLVRAWLHRREWREWVLAGVATACCGLQFATWKHRQPQGIPAGLVDRVGFDVVPTFFGRWLVGGFTDRHRLLVAASIVVLVVAAAGVWRARGCFRTWVLVHLVVASIAMGIIRVGSAALHPLRAGPRYFFFPFIFLAWLLLQVAGSPTNPAWLRRAAATLLVVSALNALPHFGRFHEDLDWRRHVASSVHFDSYVIPVQFDGAACRSQPFTISGERSAALLARDPWSGSLRDLAVHPHSAVPCTLDALDDRSGYARIVPGHDWTVVPPPERLPPWFTVLRTPDRADGGTLTLELRRGDRFLFRSAPEVAWLDMTVEATGTTFARGVLPSTAWKTFTFANRLLPDTFRVTLDTTGPSGERWAEIAVPSPVP